VIEQPALADLDQPRQKLQLEGTSDHRGNRQDLPRLVPESLDAAPDDVADALRQTERSRSIDGPAPRLLVIEQPAGLSEAGQDLAYEEWVPAGLGRDLARQLEPDLIELVSRRQRHHLGHLGRIEPVERDPLYPLEPAQISEQRGYRREQQVALRLRI
jgi:hypothetical protein